MPGDDNSLYTGYDLIKVIFKVVWISSLLAAIAAILLFVFASDTPRDATVILNGCQPMDHQDCTFKGVLTRGKPFDGQWELDLQDGRTMLISYQQIAMISWKVPE